MVDLHYKAHKYGLLPEGLNELMLDISREVLRVQPDDIHGFIARYLGALLKARRALTIAGDVCEDIQASCCSITKEKEENENDSSGSEKEDRTAKIAVEGYATKENSCLNDGKDEINNETNESQDTDDVVQLAQDESTQDRTGSSYVEAEEYYRFRQKRDFWSHSVFSLPGSYMNLPTSKPYSAYDSITEASKPSSKPFSTWQLDHSGCSHYIVDSDEDSLI